MSRLFRFSALLDSTDTTPISEIRTALFDDNNTDIADDSADIVITDIDDGPEPGILTITISGNDRDAVKRAVSRWIDETGQDADSTDDAYINSQVRENFVEVELLVAPETDADDNAPEPLIGTIGG